MGGCAMGGCAMGGCAMGGSATGGSATGGSAMGGSVMGGCATGGSAMGGSAMGGSSRGGCGMGGSSSTINSACSTVGFFFARPFRPASEDLSRIPEDLPRALRLRPAAAAFLPQKEAAFLLCGPAFRRNQAPKEVAARPACSRARSRPLAKLCLRLGLGAGGGSLDMALGAEEGGGYQFEPFAVAGVRSFLAVAAASSFSKRETTSWKRSLACSGLFWDRRMRPISSTASACQRGYCG